MSKSILFSLLTFMALSLSAQEVVERKTSMSLGPQNGFYIDLPGATKKMAESTFSDIMKEYGKLKDNKKARELFITATKIPVVNGQSPVDLYVRHEEGKNMMTTYVWVDLGGAFANTEEHPQQVKAIRQLLTDYSNQVKRKVIAQELKEQEKNLSNLNKDLEKLQKKNDDLHKEIEKARQKIAEAEKNIEKNLSDQENKRTEIQRQGEVVDEVTARLNAVGKN
jgi:DNA repair exonuclease SbcCD ATPase subunit